MNDPLNPDVTPSNPQAMKQQLLVMRIIWAAMLFGECMFLAVIALAVLPQRTTPAQPQPIFVWVSLGMLLTVVPATFAMRAMVFRRARAGGSLSAGAFSTGNIIFWAGCEGVAFFGLVTAVVTGSLWPTIVNAAVAMSLQAITFPMAGTMGGSGDSPL